jgi:hypothetical protein
MHDFIRPQGLATPSSPLVVGELEALAEHESRTLGRRRPGLAAARVLLSPAAALVHAYVRHQRRRAFTRGRDEGVGLIHASRARQHGAPIPAPRRKPSEPSLVTRARTGLVKAAHTVRDAPKTAVEAVRTANERQEAAQLRTGVEAAEVRLREAERTVAELARAWEDPNRPKRAPRQVPGAAGKATDGAAGLTKAEAKAALPAARRELTEAREAFRAAREWERANAAKARERERAKAARAREKAAPTTKEEKPAELAAKVEPAEDPRRALQPSRDGAPDRAAALARESPSVTGRTDWAERYLAEIELLAEGSKYEELYLWPRTPLTPDHQEIIARRVGVSDLDIDDARSRPALIIGKLRELVADPGSPVDERFRLLDIACGDAVVLWQIKKAFPDARCFGIDCNKGLFSTNAAAMDEGVALYKGYLQHLFARPVPDRDQFHVAVMLNTYRGWESADLHEYEQDLPEQADTWFARNSRYAIVTATRDQIKRLRGQGWHVEELGKGEDDSVMICAAREQPHGWLARPADRLGRLVVR